MSWSVNATGKPKKVAEKLAAQFVNIKCSEPEETIKNNVATAIATGLAAYPESSAVSVSASGSQSVDSSKPGVATNSLKVSIEPIWGFVE